VNIVILWLLLIVGYPVVVTISAYFDLPNQDISIFMRAVTVLLSLFILARNSNKLVVRLRNTAAFSGFLFWLIYCTYCLFAYIINWPFFDSPDVHFGFLIGGTIIPMLALMVSEDIDIALATAMRITLPIGIFCLTVIWIGYYHGFSHSSSFYLSNDDQGRLALPSFNPIAVGSIASIVSIAAMHTLISSHYRSVSGWIGIIFGLLAIAECGSKGPLICFLVVFLLIFYHSKIKLSKLDITLMLSIVIIFSIYILDQDIAITRRLMVWEFDPSTEGHYRLMINAWYSFLSSPLYGGTLADAETQYYPHNILLESLMATGIIGTTLLYISLYPALHSAISNNHISDHRKICSSMFMLMLGISLFSGALHMAPLVFCSSVAFWRRDSTIESKLGFRERKTNGIIRNESDEIALAVVDGLRK